MEEFIETVRPSTELTARNGLTVVGQFTPEVPPVSTLGSEAGNGAKNVHWRLNQTDGPATVETDCTNENTSAT
jgi:hypothetical protein